ncbi:MAG: Soluble lytic murein transglycosylase [Firmicutes bacterium]|nr:Soluble lytic murein transglycosylase [Bacillota bacterium]
MRSQSTRLNVYWNLLIYVVIIVILLAVLGPPLWRIVYPWPYREVIERYAEANGLDPYLVAAVIRVESSFRTHATSPKGARGLMQIMPATGEWIASEVHLADFHVDRLFEVELNIKMGTWYLRHLTEQFGRDVEVALAAYNGGRGNVKNWLEQGIWSGHLSDIEQVPFRETRNYVTRVLRTYAIYRELY